MCGITGAIWTSPARAIDAATLARMTALVAHRGPDDEGCFRSELRLTPGLPAEPGVALGQRRLAIIDLPGGHQPISNETGTIWAVFNGEIYNFPALRKRLEGSGHVLRSAGDTETIVHLYEDDGPEFARHLIGMFAIAIWDQPRRQLTLVRDRLGQKPLVYRLDEGRISFASELKSLLAMPGAERTVDPAALDEYLTYQYVPYPNTIVRGIRKLPPAHYAVWRDGQFSVRPYWEPNFNEEIARPAEEYRQQMRELLTDSVRLRMQSDVPLGAFLSGGVDSSLVVGLMSEQSAKPVRTFSIGFDEPDFDETRYARQVAQRFGCEHTELRIEPRALDVLPKLARHFDEPMADSSAVPTWYVSQLARQHVTVALTGDGGDELFGGYDRYRAVALSAMIDRAPKPLRRLLAARLWQRWPRWAGPRRTLRRLKRFSAGLGEPIARRYLNWVGVFNLDERAALYSDDFLAALPGVDPAEFLLRAWQRSSKRDPVTAASLADLVTYLPCDLMCKVDIASMAHGLECRQPFLDHRLVELAIAMPARFKQRLGPAGFRGKRILLETFGDLLPVEIRRRRKMGFGVPIDKWLRGELRDFTRDTLLSAQARQRGYFRPAAVERLIDEHQTGAQSRGYQLWALLMLELWHRQWHDEAERPMTDASEPAQAH